MFLFLDLFVAVLGLRCFTSFSLVVACVFHVVEHRV